MSSFDRRNFLKTTAATAVAATVPGLGAMSRNAWAADTVTVGILHSLSGTIAIAEAAIVDAEKMAIDEINAAGGVLGKQIQAITEDGASDWPTFAEKAKKLLEKDKVAAVFGCYTSASRKAVLPVFEKNNGLLYYPTYYEGQEQSKNVIYTAQEATQSVIAACEWLAQNKGKNFFLVGSDYIYPRTCNKIAKPTIARLGGKVLGEEYIPLGNTEFASVINKIKAAKPDVIYSTVVGGSNVAFYKQLVAAGLSGDKMTLLSTVVSENEISGIGAENAVGYYACMGYFQSQKNPANDKFVKAIKAKYGQDRVVGDPMECGYTGVYFWKLACEKAKSFDVDKVVAASGGIEFDAPEGKIKLHATNHHTWKHARIGRALKDGQFEIVQESPLIEPNPFPKL
jgi:urea transport system substrate-binding protein